MGKGVMGMVRSRESISLVGVEGTWKKQWGVKLKKLKFRLYLKDMLSWEGKVFLFFGALYTGVYICTPWTTAHQASLSITNSWSLPKIMSIKSVMPSNHLILCHPLRLLPSILPSIRFFPNESVLHIRWPKYWSFSFSISLSNGCSGLISFRIDWLGLLAVQGTLKCLLQHRSSKASILRCSAFFTVQLSHPYNTWPLEKP